MSFGDLVGNEKGVPHAFVRCADCVSCVQKPNPAMVVFGRPEGSLPVEYICAGKGTVLDRPEEMRMCSSYECKQPQPKEETREYCVSFSGSGHTVIRAKSEDEAWDLAENGMIDMGDFKNLVIEGVEVNL